MKKNDESRLMIVCGEKVMGWVGNDSICERVNCLKYSCGLREINRGAGLEMATHRRHTSPAS